MGPPFTADDNALQNGVRSQDLSNPPLRSPPTEGVNGEAAFAARATNALWDSFPRCQSSPTGKTVACSLE